MNIRPAFASWLQVGPLASVLGLFFGIPVVVVVVVSFFDFDHSDIIPTFIMDNYADIFESDITLRLYWSTLKFAAIVWAITLVIGFTLANYLVFHINSLLLKIGLFLLCSVPFWTSTIIRMISWIPFLGRNGLFNQMLIGGGITTKPLDSCCFQTLP